MRADRNLGNVVVEAALGACLALLATGLGLWLEAARPALPGTAPAAGFHTLVPDMGLAGRTNRLSIGQVERLDAQFPDLSLMGSLSRDGIAEVNDAPVELRYDLVFGPLLDQLGIHFTGRALDQSATQLPIRHTPVREVVISHALATRLHGTPEHALERTLRVANMQWPLQAGQVWEDFLIVGVAPPSFRGIDVERPADFWMGINGWSNVLFPPQQIEDVRRHFAVGALAVDSNDPAIARTRLSRALTDLGGLSPQVQLAPGAGYHPERRARFSQISQSLMTGLQALGLTLCVCAVAFALTRAERERQPDSIRRMLGERGTRWLARHLRKGATSLATVGLFTAATLWLLRQASHALPLDRALDRFLTAPAALTVIATTALLLLLLHPALMLWLRLAGPMQERRRSLLVSALFTILVCSVLFAWSFGTSGVQRLSQLLHVDLPPTSRATSTAALDSRARSWMFDRSDTRAFAEAVQPLGIALASTGPVGLPMVVLDATVETGSESARAQLPVNHVSTNYFSVIGTATRSLCGGFDTQGEDSAWVNQRFLEAYGITRDPGSARIRTHDGTVLRICGIAGNAQVANARAGLAPMLYMPLRERRHLAAAVLPTDGAQARLSLLQPLAERFFPDIVVQPARTTEAALAAQLAQEREVAALNAVLMGIAALAGFISASLLGQAAIGLNLRALATRRALGESGISLVSATLFGRRWPLRLASLALIALVLFALGHLLDAPSGGTSVALGVALAATAALIALVVGRLLRDVRDGRLLQALKSE